MATLLLADDSPTIHRVVELTFATDDIQVVSVSDGVEAVAQIDADRPDIVLADVGMPRLDGYGVASHIKKAPALKDIPVLLLTGAFDPIDEDRARACGCDGVLIKPFEPQQLIRRVRELLRAQPPRPRVPIGAPTAETVTAAPDVSAAPGQGSPLSPPASPVAPGQSPTAGLTGVPPIAATARDAGVPDDAAAESTFLPRSDHQSESMFGFGPGLHDDLSAAFGDLEVDAMSAGVESEPVPQFAQDLDFFQKTDDHTAPANEFENWDLPARPPIPDMEVSQNGEDKLAAVPDASAHPEVGPETAGEDQASAAAPPQALHELPLGTPPRMSLASAFSALLAAEQSQSPLQTRRPTPPQLSDMAVEEMVRRALSRMTDDAVRRIVLETAERLVREEIDKIKSQPS